MAERKADARGSHLRKVDNRVSHSSGEAREIWENGGGWQQGEPPPHTQLGHGVKVNGEEGQWEQWRKENLHVLAFGPNIRGATRKKIKWEP